MTINYLNRPKSTKVVEKMKTWSDNGEVVDAPPKPVKKRKQLMYKIGLMTGASGPYLVCCDSQERIDNLPKNQNFVRWINIGYAWEEEYTV